VLLFISLTEYSEGIFDILSGYLILV